MLPVIKYLLIVLAGCVVITAIVLTTYFNLSKGGADKCMTSENRSGICVEQSNCLNGIGINGSTDLSTLNVTKCGEETGRQMVCCPKFEVLRVPNSKPGLVKSLNPVFQRPPNVTGHPNIYLLPKVCGQNGDEQILGGRGTGLYQYPWMALIIHKNGSTMTFACGGTIINSRYILTAAHCVTNLGPDVKVAGVRVGDHDLSTDTDCEWRDCAPEPQDFYQVELIPHSRYNTKTRQNDIALVRLEDDIDFGLATSQPICLPVTSDWANMNLVGLEMTVAGWGLTEHDNFTSDVLLETNIPVLDNKKCEHLYGSPRSPVVVSYNQVCAGGQEGIDTCNGDSGGPLKMLTRTQYSIVFVQYGIVSIGPQKCGTLGKPGIYTRVAYYMDWILDNMKPADHEEE